MMEDKNTRCPKRDQNTGRQCKFDEYHDGECRGTCAKKVVKPGGTVYCVYPRGHAGKCD
jgi:hypothetical protein